jgi:hypothetical protein
MKRNPTSSGIDRRALLSALAVLPALSGTLLPTSALAQTATSGDVLPSWNDGPVKQAIVTFVKETTDQASPKFVPPAERIATFDQAAHCGSSTRFTRRRCTAWSVCRRWSRRNRSLRRSSR